MQGMPPYLIEERLAEEDNAASLSILEEHFTAYRIYCRCQTQWRTGMSGATGLDYSVIYQTMDRMDLSNDEQIERIDQIALIEQGILDGWAEQRDNNQPRG